jgi:dTDP-L-rhamnose 4-epimerase
MYEPHYYVHTNATGTGQLLDRLVKRGSRVSRLVVASSMSLYGEGACRCTTCGKTSGRERATPQLESGRWEIDCATCGDSMEPQPTPESKAPTIASVYAATKKHQEDLFVAWGRAYRIPTFALRFFNVYGPRQSLSNPYTGVAAIFLSRLLNGKPPLLFEDGRQCRDFVDVRDIARALVLALEANTDGTHVLNIGTGRPTSVADLAVTLAKILGVEASPVLLNRYRAGDIRHCYADASLAREVLGFEAQYTLEQGLPSLIEWCRGQPAADRVEQGLSELQSKGLVV